MSKEVPTIFPEETEFKDKVIFRKNTEFHGNTTFFGDTVYVDILHVPFKISENIEELDKKDLEAIIVNLLDNSKKQNKTILKYSKLIEEIANTNTLRQDNISLRDEVNNLQSRLDKINDIYEGIYD